MKKLHEASCAAACRYATTTCAHTPHGALQTVRTLSISLSHTHIHIPLPIIPKLKVVVSLVPAQLLAVMLAS